MTEQMLSAETNLDLFWASVNECYAERMGESLFALLGDEMSTASCKERPNGLSQSQQCP